jgi:hypothetical protein
MTPEFILEQQGREPITDPPLDMITAELDQVSLRARSYFIFSHRGGSYVQAAGARAKMMVEYRAVHDGGWAHYVLGHRGGEERETSINYSFGPLTLRAKQVFTLREVTAIFAHFLESGEVPDSYDLEDISTRFED